MDLQKCKSYTEIGKKLGYSYYNGNVKKQIFKYCKENNLNIEEIIQNNNKPNICLNCGKEIEGKYRFKKKFCNSSCAASFNNKGKKHSEETKMKISKTFLEKRTLEKELTCLRCGKIFKVSLKENGRFSRKKYCSEECRRKSSNEKNSSLAKERVKNGTHQGWKTRNIISYPEKFWMKVLNNNSISFHKEYHIDNKYFLDFFIEKNEFKIDLEIDGKQHLYEDRKLHDIERDKYLTEKGYIVYRIPWNEINSEQGKEKMKQKIEEFLTFFNNLKN